MNKKKGKLRPTLWAWAGTPSHLPVRNEMLKKRVLIMLKEVLW